jgi:hypothetical protein
MPQSRYWRAEESALNPYGSGPFCRFQIPRSYAFSGVYVISHASRALYVGKAANLSKRFNHGYGNISPINCFMGGQTTNCKVNMRILRGVKRGLTLDLWFMPTRDRDSIETLLIRSLDAPWNG